MTFDEFFNKTHNQESIGNLPGVIMLMIKEIAEKYWNAALYSQLRPITEVPEDQDRIIMYLTTGGELFGRYIDGEFIEYNSESDRFEVEVEPRFIKYWITIPERPAD